MNSKAFLATVAVCAFLVAGYGTSGGGESSLEPSDSTVKPVRSPLATTSEPTNVPTSTSASAPVKRAPLTTSAPTDLSLFEALVYKDGDGNEMPYRLLKPANYDPGKKYPVVLLLHGGGGQGNDNLRHMGGVELVLTRPELRAKFPCFAIAPQCPANSSWSGKWRPASQPATASKPATASAPADTVVPLKLAMAILEKTRKDFSIDDGRIYVTGASMGGAGTWLAIAGNPRLFTAAVPICGWADVATAKQIADARLPLWVWHGEKDSTVRVAASRDMVKALKDAGLEVKYTECPGVGHNVWDTTFADDAVWTWMFSQRK